MFGVKNVPGYNTDSRRRRKAGVLGEDPLTGG